MDAKAPVARVLTFLPESVQRSKTLHSLFARRDTVTPTKTWIPNALRPWILCLTTLFCWSLIAVLQYLLHKSETESGIIFAPKIIDLPLKRRFLYLYFPTILAVIFSIFWAWVDLETKRLEPYYQLSKKDGALGKDSILLHYPFDFVPLVPIKALRDRHWPVFWASSAIVLVTWGLVPTQAGIFSIENVSRNYTVDFSLSTKFLPALDQLDGLSIRYAQSTYGIINLNETLPPYMTHEFMLKPFEAVNNDRRSDATWSTQTTLYSLDMNCDSAEPQDFEKYSDPTFLSSNGCALVKGMLGNTTMGVEKYTNITIKEFTALYVGYQKDVRGASFLVTSNCTVDQAPTFMASFTRNKRRAEDPPSNVTSIFCTPTYYEQDVNATIDAVSRRPLDVVRLGEKRPLQARLFNATIFEEQVRTGKPQFIVRDDLIPIETLPDYTKQLANSNLSLKSGDLSVPLQPIEAMATLAGGRPLVDYLDEKMLQQSYEKAYRMLFLRAMVEIMKPNFTEGIEQKPGFRQSRSQAVVLEPIFTYLVEALLGLASVSALALLYLSIKRERRLKGDPSTIAAVMSLVADNHSLLAKFENLDCCSTEEMVASLRDKRFKLVGDDVQTRIVEVVAGRPDESSPPPYQRQNTQRDIVKPVRPIEFRLFMAVPFVGIFCALAIVLGALLIKSRPHGLPIPSKTFVKNLLTNYLPVALATLIEPMWILVNRLLCMLQPLEELRSCNASARRSIDLNYSSLPPQLTIFKAVRCRHFVLATVCGMSLLANLLAISFADLFEQDTAMISTPMTFWPSITSELITASASDDASTNVTGSQIRLSNDQFYVAESNFTEGTPLPAWVDDKMMYIPFMPVVKSESLRMAQYQGRTSGFGVDLDCKTLQHAADYEGDVSMTEATFNTTVDNYGKKLPCFGRLDVRKGPLVDYTVYSVLLQPKSRCVSGQSALEFVFRMQAAKNATQQEKDICASTVNLGWMRDADGTCGSHNQTRTLDGSNSIFLSCRPKLTIADATIVVDSEGRVQRTVGALDVKVEADTEKLQQMITVNNTNLAQSSLEVLYATYPPTWHNDSFVSDFANHFMKRITNSTRFIDPTAPLPEANELIDPLRKTFSRLFAIWLGANVDQMFVPVENSNRPIVGSMLMPAERLFFNIPLLAISLTILAIYAIVAIIVYLRRPGQFLARLPISIASCVSMFAASAAVQDLRKTSHFSTKERAQLLEKQNLRYGYGSYMGGDGRIHIGIEKTPFVRTRRSKTWFERKINSFRKI